MKTNCLRYRESSTANEGFTMTDLLVLTLIIALLFGIHFTAMASSKGRVHVAQCASNLRQFSLALHIFANENDGNLPASGGFYWAWNIPWMVGGFIEGTGTQWTSLYCPGTSYGFTEADNQQLYWWSPNSYRVTGYANTFPNTAGVSATNWNRTLNPQRIQVGLGQFIRPFPSERVLLADATISAPGQNNPALRHTYKYTLIQGGYYKPHLSPHLEGKIPLGGNLAMLDGHVRWRDFEKMLPRTQGSSPVFWW